jgi:disulfide bond formation protein DsbB
MSGMTVTQLHNFFAVLALVAIGGAVLMLLARIIPSVASVRFLGLIHKVQLPLAALVATTASLGSLYMSEYGNRWTPCRFCWFQRIFMYSAAVVLIMAAIRRDRGVKWYAVPLASIGILLSGYHMLLERGVITESTACDATGVKCTVPYFISFGHRDPNTLGPAGFPGVTLAVMAFCGFAAILALLLLPEPLDLDTPVELTEKDDHHGEPAAR